MTQPNEVPVSDLRCLCDPSLFDFETTADIPPLDQVIGQERAVRAITFGLEMKSAGYHIFVTGPEGTGKTTIVQEIVGKAARQLSTPSDWCMVNNFKDAYRPRAIAVSPGQATRFAKSLGRLVTDLKIRLPKEFQEDPFRQKVVEIQERYGEEKQSYFDQLDRSAGEKQLKVEKIPSGYQTIPMNGDAPYSQEEFEKLPDKDQRAIEKTVQTFQEEIQTALREVNRINHTQQKEIQQLANELALFVVRNRLDLIRENYPDQPEILAFLDEIQADMVENVALFLPRQANGDDENETPANGNGLSLNRYRVNVLEDRSGMQGAPVVFEPNPTYANVFGHIDKKAFMGTLVTDFTMVQAGALLQANGGFLILEVETVLAHPQVWESLKRALQNKMLCIEDMAQDMGLGTASLRPAPVPLDVKVILLGGYEPFQVLQNYDAKFNKIFRVRADFDYEVVRTDETIRLYAQFIARVCKNEGLLPFSANGVASVVEYGEKAIDSQRKLSLRFGAVTGVIKEADYWARKEAADRVTEAHVFKAFSEYRFRYNLYEEKIHESYVDGTIMIDVAGEAVGQVNALAVYQIGEIAFGRPSRITAETFMGRPGIVNIERESKLSGKSHDKGVLILSGYLGRTFARRYPLSLAISLTFEQSYSGIDGDSASSTELYAILSSLSGLPIRQGIAVTGSVNQKGQIQAIGGVNQKIEGFFDVCQSKGLTGDQGVMIPAANVKNLMLKKSVIDAVAANRFRIWQVSTVEAGIEILTGQSAGTPDSHGNYPPETVYGKVQQQLTTYLKQSLKLKKQYASKK
ncbi:ATP-dependent protease [Desulfosarcina ovata subsp. sediminis]|uniref:endopeptidase La n=1 Tax=Desulfosarcina ovata subsp. sediminis TaxID=885957 RepID=A0A5K7ZF15_9BACT|nr:ATP-binding protein [Desulfosarcina ovata]BBO80738.1 ATP-dependent protease [Desulfosarcina ovata subsp. sediminis]